MAKKVSKNSRVGQRAANAGSGRDHVRVVKSIKDPITGKYWSGVFCGTYRG